jgi:hypothetical protein
MSKDKNKEKSMKQIIEVSNEGLESLLGKRVLIMTAGYFYEGKLVGVNDSFLKLSDASIVYETGEWSDKEYKDIQKLHTDEWYIQTGLIESYGVSKND